MNNYNDFQFFIFHFQFFNEYAQTKYRQRAAYGVGVENGKLKIENEQL
jgi:hypothetical protein